MEANNKTMREALTKILDLTNSLDEDCAVDPVEIRDIAKAALSAPARNCDVGTAREIDARWNAYCEERIKRENCMSNKNCKGCSWRWAQMPYNEEGVKVE